jgi:hypothetical protein
MGDVLSPHRLPVKHLAVRTALVKMRIAQRAAKPATVRRLLSEPGAQAGPSNPFVPRQVITGTLRSVGLLRR